MGLAGVVAREMRGGGWDLVGTVEVRVDLMDLVDLVELMWRRGGRDMVGFVGSDFIGGGGGGWDIVEMELMEELDGEGRWWWEVQLEGEGRHGLLWEG